MDIKNQPDLSVLISSIANRKKGAMMKKVSVFLDDGVKIEMDAFKLVDELPSVSEAKENVFYITPNDNLNFVEGGEWHTISGGGGSVETLNDEEWESLWDGEES